MWASSLFECEKRYMFAPEATCEDFIFQIHVLIHVGLPMFTRESFPTAMLVPHRHVVFQDEFALLRFFFHHKHHKQVTWNMYMFFQVWDVLPNDYKFWTLLKPQVSSNKITTCLRASGKFWTCRATSPQKTSNKTCLLRRVDDKTDKTDGIWRDRGWNLTSKSRRRWGPKYGCCYGGYWRPSIAPRYDHFVWGKYGKMVTIPRILGCRISVQKPSSTIVTSSSQIDDVVLVFMCTLIPFCSFILGP